MLPLSTCGKVVKERTPRTEPKHIIVSCVSRHLICATSLRSGKTYRERIETEDKDEKREHGHDFAFGVQRSVIPRLRMRYAHHYAQQDSDQEPGRATVNEHP